MNCRTIIRNPAVLGIAAAFTTTVWSQEMTRGAALYMRLANDSASCVSCHGPDPGLNPNNIQRAADQPTTLVKVLNTVSAMGFLRSQLSDQDHRDIAAFLGSVLRLNAPSSAIRMWPVTMDFGSMAVNVMSARQIVRIENTSATNPVNISDISASESSVEVAHDCPAELPPAATCELAVHVRPAGVGLVHGAVRVITPSQTQVVALVAKGAPVATSQLEWLGVPATVDFAAHAAQALSHHSFRLTNSGPLPAVLGQASIVGPHANQFRIESGCRSGQVLLALTSCDLVVSFSANLLARPQALLQLRSDQVNPPAVLLEGAAAAADQAEPLPLNSPTSTPMPPAQVGGGCSVANVPASRPDVILMACLVIALLCLGLRLRRPSSWRAPV
jgi:cytochrome c553